jgi:hypothetical protein
MCGKDEANIILNAHFLGTKNAILDEYKQNILNNNLKIVSVMQDLIKELKGSELYLQAEQTEQAEQASFDDRQFSTGVENIGNLFGINVGDLETYQSVIDCNEANAGDLEAFKLAFDRGEENVDFSEIFNSFSDYDEENVDFSQIFNSASDYDVEKKESTEVKIKAMLELEKYDSEDDELQQRDLQIKAMLELEEYDSEEEIALDKILNQVDSELWFE